MLGRLMVLSAGLCVSIVAVAVVGFGLRESDSGQARSAPVTAQASQATTPAATTPAPASRGRTYYVSPSGSDAGPGTSQANAWRTVARVNGAALRPGDTVLFEGGKTFAGALKPSRSGQRNRRITYGSYGGRRAGLTAGIKLKSVNWIVVRGFVVRGAARGVTGSQNGLGVDHVTIERNVFERVDIGVFSANRADSGWMIRDNKVSQTRDSGMILYGSDFLITGNSILDTGTDSSIDYGKHGIYLKVIGARVTANTIRRFPGNGVSVRYRNSIVDDNVISDGPIGIAWFQYDSNAGTSYWRRNRISGTTSADVYVSRRDQGGRTRESFVITDNTLSKHSGVYIDLKPTTGSYAVRRNRHI